MGAPAGVQQRMEKVRGADPVGVLAKAKTTIDPDPSCLVHEGELSSFCFVYKFFVDYVIEDPLRPRSPTSHVKNRETAGASVAHLVGCHPMH